MKNSFKWFIGASINGFIAAVLGTFAVGHPNSALAPLILFFTILSILMICVAAVGSIEVE